MKKLSIIVITTSFALSGCAVVQFVGDAAWETKHSNECIPGPNDPVGVELPGCNVPPPLKDEDEPKYK